MTADGRIRGKRLLILGASPMRGAAFGAWRRLGLGIVLVDGHSQGRYEDLVDEFYAWDVRDETYDLDQILRVAETCDGVTTLVDNSQRCAAAVADALGLPGVGPKPAELARSKARQREMFQEAGFAVPRWAKVRAGEDLERFFAEVDGAAAVIKPIDAAGGAGAIRVADVRDALRSWPIVRSLSAARTAIVEEFLDGWEVCVDAVVRDGEIMFASSAEVEHMRTTGFLCTSSSYATENCWAGGDDFGSEYIAVAVRLTREVVRVIGAGDGIIHVEYKISGDRWTLVELGLRPGGALVPELTLRVSGMDLYAAMARLALGVDPLARLSATPVAPYAQARYLVGEGVVRSFVPPATVLADLPDVKVVVQQLAAGQRARMPLSEAGRAGYAYGWGADRIRLDRQLRDAIDRLGEQMGLVVRGNRPDDELSSEYGPGPWWHEPHGARSA